jgi:hypothetical protein
LKHERGSCNCQYNCHEGTTAGPSMNSSPCFSASQEMRIMLFIYLSHCGIFLDVTSHMLTGLNVQILFYFFIIEPG